MTEKELTAKLTKLDYSILWIYYGVLTVEYLNEQLNIFENSKDQNTEHYRYAAFKKYLSSRNELSDKELENYIKLAVSDNDSVMAGSAVVNLFHEIELTDEQFQMLYHSVSHFGKRIEKIVLRQQLLRKLKNDKLTDDLFTKCIETGDAVIQQYLITISDINQLEQLNKKGFTSKVRNMASEKIKSLKRNQI